MKYAQALFTLCQCHADTIVKHHASLNVQALVPVHHQNRAKVTKKKQMLEDVANK